MESLIEANNKVKWSMHGIGGDVFLLNNIIS